MGTVYKCRLCLNTTSKKIDVFKDDFPKMIQLLAGIKVDPNDGLLNTSCLECAKDVKFCMTVRTQIQKSHRILLQELWSTQGIACKSLAKPELKSAVSKNLRSSATNKKGVTRKKTVKKREKTPDSTSEDDMYENNSEDSYSSDGDNFMEPTIEVKPEGTTASESGETVVEEITVIHEVESKCESKCEPDPGDNEGVKLESVTDSFKFDNHSDIREPVSTPSAKRLLKKRNMIAASNRILSQSSSLKDRRYSNVIFVRKSRREKMEKKNQVKITTAKKEKKEDPNVIIKNGKKYAACEICKREVKKHYMKYHMTTHFPKHFSCDICGATTRNLRGLRYHKLYWHSSKLDYICDKCGKKYRSKHALDLHNKKEHGGIRDLECNICGKKFFQKSSAPNHIQISRKSLYMLFKDSDKRKLDEKLLEMEHKLREITRCPENEFRTVTANLRHFKSDLKQRWSLANNTEARFLIKNENWLNSSITIPSWSTISTSKQGRPMKPFHELSDRSKRRKTKELREHVPAQELTYAASVSQRTSGNIEASKIIKEVTANPTRAKKFKEALVRSQKVSVKKHTPSEALSLLIECDLTKRQYEVLRESNKSIYPCYSLIKEAKKDCYPREESTRVTETCAEVLLQDLLNHTASRLCKYLEDVFETCTPEELLNMELITKWGCDGSQQSRFQQKFQDDSEDDSNIFISCLVPIRLQSNIGDQKKILWQNPTPSSPRFCRPIRIRFLHETADVTREEIKYINDQIKQLTKTELSNSNGGMMYVQHTLVMTMVDAKVCNAATTTTSTMRCYICGKSSKDFNNLKATKTENPEALTFGISILHARIRVFETLLHIAYKLPLKKWQAKGQNEKNIVKQTKEKIQKDFKEKTGLLVDVPKAGFGNSNSGNTSRRFFSDPETAAEITGIDICLIQKLKVILEAISSGYQIDADKFASFANETAKLYLKLYGWHPMTPTLHKILVHGSTIIKHALLPIGQLSEEAAEARNKHFRSYRLDFSRKFSRQICNKDVFNRLLLTSDPFLSCGRIRKKLKRSTSFLPETIELFKEVAPEVQSIQELSTESVCEVSD